MLGLTPSATVIV